MRRLILIGALLLVLSACGEAASTNAGPPKADTIKQYDAHPGTVITAGTSYAAVIKTNLGDLSFELLPDESPLAVNSFVFLAREGFFDGVPFHRIIPGFMAQGGDPTGRGTEGPGYRFDIETPQHPYTRGSLAMANAGPGTNGSQFFIVFSNLTAEGRLRPDYSLFGQMTDGEESLAALEAIPVGPSMSGERSKPLEEARIVTVEIIER
jgi:cyclophilin family peptidyl-prolyl cis-trans isomerase